MMALFDSRHFSTVKGDTFEMDETLSRRLQVNNTRVNLTRVSREIIRHCRGARGDRSEGKSNEGKSWLPDR